MPLFPSEKTPGGSPSADADAVAADVRASLAFGKDCTEDDIQCQDYQLEETLGMYEASIVRWLDEAARSCWQSDVACFRRLLEACGDMRCREKSLLQRLSGMHGMLPDPQRTSLELPAAPLLLAVIAPEPEARRSSDQAAPDIPLEVHGQLVHAMDDAEHMGIAVRSDAGLDHVFIQDADLGNQPGHQEIQGLVGTSPNARVLVRGSPLTAADGVANFDPSACRLAYQMP